MEIPADTPFKNEFEANQQARQEQLIKEIQEVFVAASVELDDGDWPM